MEEDVFDAHLCLQCHITIIGLENYIKHKKELCPGKKSSRPSYPSEVISSVPQSSVPSFEQYSNQDDNQTSQTSLYDSAAPTYEPLTPPPIRGMPSQHNQFPSGTDEDVTPSLPPIRGLVSGSFPVSHAESSVVPQSHYRNPVSTSVLQGGQFGAEVSASTVSYNTLTSPSIPSYVTHTSQHTSLVPPSGLVPSGSHHAYGTSSSSSLGAAPVYGTPTRESNNLDMGSSHVFGTPSRGTSDLSMENGSSVFGTPSRGTASLGVDVSVADAMANFVSGLSPAATSRLIDPNMVLYHSQAKGMPSEPMAQTESANIGIADFLSSLDLQYKSNSGQGKKSSTMMSHQPSIMDSDRMDASEMDHGELRISSILNDLNFSGSDSEGFDATDLLDFSDDESDHPSPMHTGGKWRAGTGGKWKPGSKLNSQQKRFRQSGGKWASTGGKWASTGGKWKPGEGPFSQRSQSTFETVNQEVDDEQIIEESSSLNSTLSPLNSQSNNEAKNDEELQDIKPKRYTCEPCKRTYFSCSTYSAHLRTNFHQRRANPTSVSKKSVSYLCKQCDKEFSQIHNFARHLLSDYHAKRRQTGDGHMFLDPRYQKLLLKLMPFQCRICCYYFKRYEDYMEHMSTESHCDACDKLMGPIKCVRCKFNCKDHQTLLAHVNSKEHEQVIAKSERPCVVRESRSHVQCPVCAKVHHSVTALKVHMLSFHDPTKPKSDSLSKKNRGRTECPKCGKVCKSRYAFVIHDRRAHTKERPHKCYICDKSFVDRSSLNMHTKSQKHLTTLCSMGHSARLDDGDNKEEGIRENIRKRIREKHATQVKCEHCSFTCKSFKDLRSHINEHHSKEKLHACEICGMDFVHRREYIFHLQTKTHKLLKGMNEKQRQGIQLYNCKICKKVWQNKQKFKTHMSVHVIAIRARGKDGLGGIPEKYKELVRNLSVLPSKVHCPHCEKLMPRHRLREHLRCAGGNKPYQCILCENKFRELTALQRHVALHYDAKDYPCDQCGKVFQTSHRLQAHMVKHGVGVLKYECNTCRKRFVFRYQLKEHMKMHMEKLHKCTYPDCRGAFRHRHELVTHIRVHTKERPFLCDFCGYAASTKQQLNRHNKVHTGERNFKCEYCTYKSKNSTNLRRHMRIHIGSKPYKCPYCTYTCNNTENMRKHIMKTKKHAGMYIYPCQYCTYGTQSSKDFKDHIINEHNVDGNQVGIISMYCGWYNKNEDPAVVEEGGIVHQPQPKKAAHHTLVNTNTKAEKGNREFDHSYIKADIKPKSNFHSKMGELGESLASELVAGSKFLVPVDSTNGTDHGVQDVSLE